MTGKLPQLGAGVNDALKRLHTFRPTEAAIIQRELTRLRRTIANRAADPEILPQDLTDLASRLDQTRRLHRTCTSLTLVDVVVSAGWTPPKGTG